MKLVNFYRKPISMFVMLTFTILLCFWANQSPAAPLNPGPEKNSKATMEQKDSSGPNFIEEEGGSAATVRKSHKFPWLLVGAVVVIGAAALYFLVLKSTKYNLTVSLTGATGTPAATAKYKKGTTVTYNYTAQSGYVNLEVKLDGAVVPASGSITMNTDHALTATAVQGALIQVNSTPAGAKIYLDNSDSGYTTPHGFQYPNAVTKAVLVRMCGYGDYAETVTANLGQTITVNPTLATGIHEDFNVPAASCWTPSTASYWSTSGGVYIYTNTLKNWDYSYYDHAFSGDYTVTAKMRRVHGSIDNSIGLFLASSNNMSSNSGYIFQYTAGGGWWSIWMPKTFEPRTDNGTWAWIRGWQKGGPIAKGFGAWNTLKVVKAGSNYSFYINDTHLYSFSNATYDPHYVTLLIAGNNDNTTMEYDFVYHSAGAGSSSIPGLPATPFTSTAEKRNSKSEL
jgi:hypothetical protein